MTAARRSNWRSYVAFPAGKESLPEIAGTLFAPLFSLASSRIFPVDDGKIRKKKEKRGGSHSTAATNIRRENFQARCHGDVIKGRATGHL